MPSQEFAQSVSETQEHFDTLLENKPIDLEDNNVEEPQFAIADMLTDPLTRTVLYTLFKNPQEWPTPDLVEHIQEKYGTEFPKHNAKVEVALRHRILPKLSTNDIITHNPDNRTVTPNPVQKHTAALIFTSAAYDNHTTKR